MGNSPLRFLSFLFILASTLFAMTACNGGNAGAGAGTGTAAEATLAAQTVMGSISLVMSNSSSWTGTTNVSFSAPGSKSNSAPIINATQARVA